MKRTACVVALLFAGVAVPVGLYGQDSPAQPQPEKKGVIPLKVDVVVNEFDGAKKVATLPYTFHVAANDTLSRPSSQVRVGLRVPVSTGSNQFTYSDVGMNIDCFATSAADGRFRVALSLDRTYLYNPPNEAELKNASGVIVASGNPVIAHFSSNYTLLLHDGQTLEGTSTTDPINGRVLRVQVTVNALK